MLNRPAENRFMDGHFVAFCDEFAWFVRRRNSATFTCWIRHYLRIALFVPPARASRRPPSAWHEGPTGHRIALCLVRHQAR